MERTVVIAEDDRDLAEVFKDTLELCGFAVVVAPDGERALALLDRVQPAAVLTDMMMPVMDGLELLRRIQARPAPRPAVIAMSALKPYLAEARKLGAVATLHKPFDFEVLEATVKAAVTGGALPPEAHPREDSLAEAEAGRLRAVLELRLDQPAPSAALTEFTERVARLFHVPICLVSIITTERQLWSAQCGLPPDMAAAGSDAREHAFCTHAVAARTALVVQDATTNPFFAHNHLVTTRGLRFYAGVPLLTRLGEAVGTLCILDFSPRKFTYFDLELLGVLSRRVLAELDWRERRMRPEPTAAFRYLTWLDEELNILGREALTEALKVQACRAAERRERLSLLAISVPREEVAHAVGALSACFDQAFLGRLGLARLGVVVPECSAAEAEARARDALGGGATVCGMDANVPAPPEWMLREVEVRLGPLGLAQPVY